MLLNLQHIRERGEGGQKINHNFQGSGVLIFDRIFQVKFSEILNGPKLFTKDSVKICSLPVNVYCRTVK